MASDTQKGFTIIEVMLFLAISGALAVAILVGSGAAIGQQRYRDSVTSLKSFIQDQYSQVSNTVNDRSDGQGCANAVIGSAPSVPAQRRGTSDCLLLGRFLTIASNGVDLRAVDVVGSRSANPMATNDIDELKNYTLGVSSVNGDADEVAWGAKVVTKKTTTPAGLSMLILRSPLSGSILTFTSSGTVTKLSDLVSTSNNQAVQDLCLDGSNGIAPGKQMEVQIPARASGPGAIQIPTESATVCN